MNRPTWLPNRRGRRRGGDIHIANLTINGGEAATDLLRAAKRYRERTRRPDEPLVVRLPAALVDQIHVVGLKPYRILTARINTTRTVWIVTHGGDPIESKVVGHPDDALDPHMLARTDADRWLRDHTELSDPAITAIAHHRVTT